MANNRTGSSRGYSGQRGGSHTRGWREDPLILERMNLVRSLRAQGFSAARMLPAVNKLMKDRGSIEIVEQTIYEDFRRIQEQIKDEQKVAAELERTALEERLDGLREVKEQAYIAFRSAAGTSLNRSAYLSVIRQAEMDMAKLQKLLDRAVTLEGEVGNEPITFTLKLSDA